MTIHPPDLPHAPEPAWLQRLAALTVILFGLMLFAHNLADVDLWGNVGFVRALPWQDGYHWTNTYSYTEPDYPWVNHEWGAEYILHHTHRLLGNTGLLGLKVLIGFVLLALMNHELTRDGVSGPVRFGLLLLCLSTMGYGFSTRPHLFTYLMITLFILLMRRRRRRWLLGLAPFLGILWANLHGAFFIGIIMLLIHTAAELAALPRDGRQALRAAAWPAAAAVLFAAGSLLNPYGLHVWQFIRESAAVTRPYLSEWAPFHPLRDSGDHSDFITLTVLILLALVRTGRRAAPLDVLLTGMALLSGLLMRRNIPFFALAAALCAGRWVETACGAPLRQFVARVPRPALTALLGAGMALSLAFTVGGHRERPLEIVMSREAFPVDLMNALVAAELEANVLWFFDWAEYAIWKLPGSRVFLDGRFDSAYSTEVIEDYLRFLYGRAGWERALAHYPTELVIVHTGNPCVPLLQAHPDWVQIHADPPAVVFAAIDSAPRFSRQLQTGWERHPSAAAVFP